MKNKFLFTLILTSLCLVIYAIKTFAQAEETFKVNKNGTLKVEISSGDIRLSVWDRDEVRVIYDDDSYSTRIKQSGNNINITSDDNSDLDISIPSEYNLNLNTSGGDVNVQGNIKGTIKINTSGGDITVKSVSGNISVNTAGGDIFCENIQGEAMLNSSGGDINVGMVSGTCKINTGGGDIHVDYISESLSITTGGGNIKSGPVGGDAKIITGGGNVTLEKVSGVLSVTTGGGNISNKGSKGGKVVTGAGNVDLEDISGGIKISSGAGNIKADFSSVEESDIKTGYGDIKVFIPSNAKVTIEAIVKLSNDNIWSVDKKDISEFIKSDFKSSTEDKRRNEYRAVYQVNGGGTVISLQSSLGVIEIRKR